MFCSIKTEEDIEAFLDITNALHDGYIIGVNFTNNGFSKIEGGHHFNNEQKKLTIEILVTSIFDTIIEIEFENIYEWQIKDCQNDIYTATIKLLDNWIIWSDDVYSNIDELKDGTYVIAESMKWRIVK